MDLALWIKNNLLTTTVAVLGVAIAIGGGVWWWKSQVPVTVEILDGSSQTLGQSDSQMIHIDVQGEIVSPGVYQLPVDSRIKDAIAAAGGMSANADRIWVARYVNMAQRVVDGAKIYIPSEKSAGISNDQLPMSNDSSHSVAGTININSAGVAELDLLSGVGEVRAQSIIAGRPYGDIQELVTKKILPQSVFDKLKEQISVF